MDIMASRNRTRLFNISWSAFCNGTRNRAWKGVVGLKFVYVVTELMTGKELGVFPSQRKADDFVFLSGKCDGMSTRTTRFKKSDYVKE